MTPVTIHLKHRFFRANGRLARKIDSGLSELNSVAAIERAEVVLERRRAASPPFIASLHLAVPGADLHATAEGFTPESAWAKAFAKVARGVRDRKSRAILRQRKLGGTVRSWNRSPGRLAFC